MPKNNHWLRRAILVFVFVLFDCFSTIVLCSSPIYEANVYARAFMESFGIPFGLMLFVSLVNLPVYAALSLNSHFVKLPIRVAAPVELCVDIAFAWFVAGLHFSGGSSWFWLAPDIIRQIVGAMLYLLGALVFVRQHRPACDNESSCSA